MTEHGRRVSPEHVAALIAGRRGHLVLGLDVDGVLAPIVGHADDARLLDGVAVLLQEVGTRLPVVVVSGRSLANLEAQFELPLSVEVVGSHGLEWRNGEPVQLEAAQQHLLKRLSEWADDAVVAAGDGAWRETKPASVVVHVRQADGVRAERALAQLRERLRSVDVRLKEGHAVVELMAVATSKATAMKRFCQRHGARSLAFIGDDLTDEEVFRSSSPADITVRVGSGATSARYRLDGPQAVRTLLQHLASPTTEHG